MALPAQSSAFQQMCVMYLTWLLVTAYQSQAATSTCNLECEDITLQNNCRRVLTYNRAGFPNFLGHKDSSEASQFQDLISEIYLDNCYQYSREFLCEFLFSECLEGVGFQLPPKTMCVDFLRGCGDNSYFKSSALKIDCDKFPEPESTEPIHVCHESVLSVTSLEAKTENTDTTYKTVPIIACIITAFIAIIGTLIYYIKKVRHTLGYLPIKRLRSRSHDTSHMNVNSPYSDKDMAGTHTGRLDSATIRTNLGYASQTYV